MKHKDEPGPLKNDTKWYLFPPFLTITVQNDGISCQTRLKYDISQHTGYQKKDVMQK